MTVDSEKMIERKLAEQVRQQGGMCIKLLCDQLTGLPDRMCLLPGGRVMFAELKTTGKKPTRIQLAVHRKFRALGFHVEVIDSIEKLNEVMNNLK